VGVGVEPRNCDERDQPDAIPRALIDCEQAELFMSRQIDGELGAMDLPLLRAHLVLCRSCREQAVHWTVQSDLLSQSLNDLTPAVDKQRKVARAEIRKPKVSPTRTFALPAGMVAAQVLALSGLFFFFSGTAEAPHSARNRAPKAEPKVETQLAMPPLEKNPAVERIEGVEVSTGLAQAETVKIEHLGTPHQIALPSPVAAIEFKAVEPVPTVVATAQPIVPLIATLKKQEHVLAAIRETSIPKIISNVSTVYSISGDSVRGVEEEHGRIEVLGDVLAGKAVIRLSDWKGNVKEVAQPDVATALKSPHREIVERFISYCTQPSFQKRFEAAR